MQIHIKFEKESDVYLQSVSESTAFVSGKAVVFHINLWVVYMSYKVGAGITGLPLTYSSV